MRILFDVQLRAAQSPYAIKAGTIIPATLVTGINSDLPGSIIAKVRRNVLLTRDIVLPGPYRFGAHQLMTKIMVS